MRGPLAADHVDTIAQHLLSPKHGSIHPPSSLLHEHNHAFRCIRERLSIRHIGKIVRLIGLDIDLEAHDSVFGKILICLSTSWDLRSRDIFEELVEWFSLDGLPSEHAIGSWQHLSEAKECLSCLVWRVSQLVLKELGCLKQVSRH